MASLDTPRLFGLIGYPLTHSFSPSYWSDRFAAADLRDHDYAAIEVPEAAGLSDVLASGQWAGLNVTIPYKQAIMPLLDEVSPEAAAIDAVNCIRFEDGRSIGHNTDAYGFEQSLLALLDGHKVANALILGSGGASAAVQYVLRGLGISYSIISRRKTYITYDDLTHSILDDHKLIVNTTPLGTYPDVNTSPRLPYDAISSDHYCYDLVYNPAKTLFLTQAEARGAAIKNGQQMLILQAERSWEIWNQ